MAIKKISELTQEVINSMSQEELIENLADLSVKHKNTSIELGSLKSKGNKNEQTTFTKEELDAKVASEIEKKSFFESNSELSEENKAKIEEMKTANPNLNYNDVLILAQNADESFGNKQNTNNSALDGGDKGNQGGSTQKLTLAQYEALGSDAEKEAYDKMSEENFGGFTLEIEKGGDLDTF